MIDDKINHDTANKENVESCTEEHFSSTQTSDHGSSNTGEQLFLLKSSIG